MAHCITHGITFDPQWEWCIYCGKPKTAELVVVENASPNKQSTPCPYHRHLFAQYGYDHFCDHPDKCEW